jgi:hypothetical protein
MDLEKIHTKVLTGFKRHMTESRAVILSMGKKLGD